MKAEQFGQQISESEEAQGQRSNPEAPATRTAAEERLDQEVSKLRLEMREVSQRKHLVDGRESWAALSSRDDIFEKAYLEDSQLQVAYAELYLKEYELDVRRGIRKPNPDVEATIKRDLETWKWVRDERKGQGAKRYMEEIRDRLVENKDGDYLRTAPSGGGRYEENPSIYAVSQYPHYERIGPRKGRRAMGLIDALQEKYNNNQKESRHTMALQDGSTLQELRGVALGALEAGQTRPALQSLWFTETKAPMDDLTKEEFDRRLAKMNSEERAAFLKELYDVVEYAKNTEGSS